ncbi:MAG: nucleotidyl transferase AbiEii/AbiGii toxin family protein [Spirochaetales bacterium]|nr:nucleotidyl transferase AbiEii/AbiGii toxin family protein [Spirochaetales bacterium]
MVPGENYLLEMITEFSKANIRFIVAGGVAMVLHGIERMTIDLDIAVDFEQENIAKFLECVYRWKMVPRAPLSIDILRDTEKLAALSREKNALVFTLVDNDNPFKQIDIFIAPEMSYKILSENVQKLTVGNHDILVVSPEKLLELKENIIEPRDKDLYDISSLKKLIKKQRQKND